MKSVNFEIFTSTKDRSYYKIRAFVIDVVFTQILHNVVSSSVISIKNRLYHETDRKVGEDVS